MGSSKEFIKKRLMFGRTAVLTALIPLLSVGCNQVGFNQTAGSVQQINALCGRGDDSTNTPGPKITSPAPDQFVQPNITLEGTCEGSADVEIGGGGLAGLVNTPCVDGHFSIALTLTSGDGLKDLHVRQADINAQNNRCVMLDTTPPRVVITTPANLYSNNNTVSVIGDCENGIPVEVSEGTGTPVSAVCSGGKFVVRFPTSAGDGPKLIVATQKDPAGNIGKDDQQYIIDTVAPRVTIATPLANAIVKNTFEVAGACETGLPVSLTGTAVLTPVTTTCNNGNYSAQVQVSNRDGTFYVTAEQIDLAGNRGWDQRNVIRDTTPPAITIKSPTAGTVAATGLPITGSCTDGLPVVISGSGVSGNQTVACGAGSFSAVVTFSNGDGPKVVQATQTDIAGNVGSDSRTFVRDSTPPEIHITGPAVGFVTRSGLTLVGTCETGLPVTVSGDTTTSTIACNNGQFSESLNLSGADGNKTINVSQTDAVGNIGRDSRTFVLDTTAPAITITAPAAGTVAQTGLTVSGNCTNGLSIEVSGDLTSPSSAVCSNGKFSFPAVFSGADGNKTVQVSQTDTAGNTGSDSRSFVKDTTPPTIQITAPDAGTRARTGLTVQGTCTTGLPVNLTGDLSSSSTTSCSNGQFQASLTFSAGDGKKTVVASQTDTAGNTGSDSRDFIRSNLGPAIKITSPDPMTATRLSLTVSGTCVSPYSVDISGGITSPVTTACSNGTFQASVNLMSPDGQKTVTASQTDDIGNTGSDSRVFVLKTSAPDIKIVSPAANSVTNGGLTLTGTCTNGLAVDIRGDILAPTSATCVNSQFSSSLTLSGSDGSKSIQVSQTDALGNTGNDSRNFILDKTPPLVKFLTPDAGTEVGASMTVTGSCESGLTVNLSGAGLAAAGSVSCPSGTFSATISLSVGDGSKTILASQTDLAGNTGSDSRAFVRDTTAPVVTIDSPAANTATNKSLTVSGSCTDGLPVNLSGDFASSTTTCSNAQWSSLITFNAPDGTKSVVASQTDKVGNTGTASRNFVLKTSAPTIRISAPAENTITKSGLTLTGVCTNGLAIQMTGAVSGTLTCSGGAFSTNVTLPAPDGTKTISVSQTDAAGNTGSDSRNFILDQTSPVVKITAPAAGTVAQNGLTVQGTCESGLKVQLSGTGVASNTLVDCLNSQFSGAINFSAGDGTKNVVASQTDLAGNSGSDNRDFVRDTTPPTITIDSPAANTATNKELTIGGSCTDGLSITLTGAILPGGAVCLSGQWSALVTFLPPDGTKNVVASQTDNAGNVGSANRNFILKTTAPAIKITAPAENSVTKSGLTLVGTCTSGLSITMSGAQSGNYSCPSGSFSIPVTFTAPDGSKTLTVSQTDSAGNTGSDSRNFILDQTAPKVAFSTPNAGSLVGASTTVTGTCEAGLTVSLSGAGIGAAGSVSCASGTFSATISLSAGDGTKNIIASQTDQAGNAGSDNRSFLRDTTAPNIKIVTPLANAVTSSSLTLTGTCESGLDVQIGGTGLSGSSSTSCSNGQFSSPITLSSPDGVKNVTVSQTDQAGNTGSDNRNFVRDSTPPAIKITSPSNGSALVGAFTVTGTCEAGLNVSLTGDVQSSANTTCSAGGTFQANLNVSSGFGSKKVTATQVDLAGNQGSDTANYVVNPKPTATETFLADQGEGKVDILFVDDNSASMDPEQMALGQKFPSFVQELTGLDWQVGITTTDCSTGKWGICGSLLNMTGTSSYILSPNVSGFDQIFNNTIQRPETLNCAARGECPSGLEEPLKASMSAIDKRSAQNAGFFRDSAALAIVILTDEDEQSNGPATATKPQAVLDKVVNTFGAAKKFKSYAITVLSGDSACLKQQQDQQGGIGAYGTFPMGLASLTGGQSVSICAPDYSVTLQQIGQDLRKLTQAVKLAHVPTAGTVQVTFTPAQNITWTVSGDTVLFNKPVAAGTKIDVTYEY